MMNDKNALLWYDDSGRDLAEKVSRAASRYYQKHGEPPTVCYCHPSAFDQGKPQSLTVGVRLRREGEPSQIEVKPLGSVLRHHFWIGVKGDD